MLETQQVEKSYKGQRVLEPTTLVFPPERTTVLIGPSGCGKTTLLKLLAGVIEPDQGAVLFDGIDIRQGDVVAHRQRMGYVLQNGGLFPHLTAGENAALLAQHLRRDSDWIDKRLAELAELVRLPIELLERYPHQLSGGQRQRVGIMRALMLDPAVVLLDEPMGALDPLVRYDLQEDLREIFRTLKKTVVLVTHDMGEAGFFGDEVALMGEGKIVQRGEFSELLQHPKNDFVRKFIQAQRLPLKVEGGADR